MSLLSAQRGQTIHYLSLEDMVVSETSVTFVVSKPLTQCKPGSKPTVVELVAYPDNPNIYVFHFFESLYCSHLCLTW